MESRYYKDQAIAKSSVPIHIDTGHTKPRTCEIDRPVILQVTTDRSWRDITENVPIVSAHAQSVVLTVQKARNLKGFGEVTRLIRV